MMDCSQCPIHPKLKSVFTDYAKKHSDIVRAKRREAGVLHVMGLCRQARNDGATGRGLYGRGQCQQRAGDPGGPGFRTAPSASNRNSISTRPTSAIRSLAGTYLASCVVFAALTGRSPVGNTYLADIDAQTATFLQNVAWETVQEYYAK